MSDEAEVSRIIQAALLNANINFPDLPDGSTRDAIYRNAEDSEHLGRAVLAALKEAGYEIRKLGKGGAVAMIDTGSQERSSRAASTEGNDWPDFSSASQRER
jgi:hypothetical protein